MCDEGRHARAMRTRVRRVEAPNRRPALSSPIDTPGPAYPPRWGRTPPHTYSRPWWCRQSCWVDEVRGQWGLMHQQRQARWGRSRASARVCSISLRILLSHFKRVFHPVPVQIRTLAAGGGEPFSIGSKNSFLAMGCMKESRSSCPSYSDSNATRRMCMCVPRGTDTQSQLGSSTARSALDCPQRQHARRPQGLAPLARTPTIFSCLIQSPGTQAKQGGFDNESDNVCKSNHIPSCASRGAVCCCSFRFSLGFSLVVF